MKFVHAGEITSSKGKIKEAERGFYSLSDELHAKWCILVALFIIFSNLKKIHNLFQIFSQCFIFNTVEGWC